MRSKRMSAVLFVAAMVIGVLVLAACQPVMPEGDSAAMAETSAEADAPAETGDAEMPEHAAELMVASNDELGEFLVDGAGMTLYMFLRDEPEVSNCYDQCAERWPPLFVEGEAKLADGVDAALVGTTERTDGSLQVTYNGWPLYYWYEDVAAGDTLGQTVGDVWFVLSPAGELVGYVPPDLMVGNSDELGDFLVDGEGMTLYMFTRDEPGVSNCYDQCAERWPPLVMDGEPALADGLDAALVGATERTDGSMQVTYNGWPLYYWYEDVAAGDTLGQTVGDVWYVLTPAGEIVQ